jgi:hypothetical protein
MTPNELIDYGNQLRAENNPEAALGFYAQAFVMDRNYAPAWNNYGNVLRELGDPAGAIPFLQRAITLEPGYVHAKFNLAISYLLMGDYVQGFDAYESRWDYEHLAGTLPKIDRPRWLGEDINGKTILVVGEQGHGDNIQFVRFVYSLAHRGARVKVQTTTSLVGMFGTGGVIEWSGNYSDDPGEFDCWVPMMSIPKCLGQTLEKLPSTLGYLNANPAKIAEWSQRLGPKKKMRVGFCWSGRKDNWLNAHKGIPFPTMLSLIKQNPEFDWVNLQIDATPEEEAQLVQAGVLIFPGSTSGFADTAGQLMHMDVVVTVDTAVAHLAGALGRPTWIMLNKFAVDWRWLVDRNTSPWYSTALLFRQEKMGDWSTVCNKITKNLKLYKI